MDGSRFDTIARELATRLTRRRVVAGMLGLASGAGALAGADGAAAVVRCRLAGDKCVRPAQCCTGLCEQRASVPRSQRNRCICPAGLTACKGQCVELGTEDHCSRCGDACLPTQVCEGGTCVCPDPDTVWCRGEQACVSLDTEDNCGRCGRACPPTQVCDGGTCICPDPGTVYCRAARACVPLGTEANCLSCGDTCATGGRCVAAGCECVTGEVDCGGDCTSLGTEANCQACGDMCGDGEACCDDGCTELGTMDNCSECGEACSTSGTGSSKEMCNGADGCQTYCQAAAGGFVTTDDPPVIYPGSVANDYSHLAYLGPTAPNPNNFKTCVTSADCDTACPTNLVPGAVACGCIKYKCKNNGTEEFHFINTWNEIPADTYVCMVLTKY